MVFFDEELIEPIARYFRFKQGLKFVKKDKSAILIDLGCGPKIRFYHFAEKRGVKFKKYIGIDPLINTKTMNFYEDNKNIQLIKSPLKRKIPLLNNSADFLVAFAFVEHLENSENILLDSVRVLKKGGKAVFTTPSSKAKSLLEFLAFKLKLLSKREIVEHKNYFDKKHFLEMLSKKRKQIKIAHRYFEFGLNNLVIITKIK